MEIVTHLTKSVGNLSNRQTLSHPPKKINFYKSLISNTKQSITRVWHTLCYQNAMDL